MNDWGNQLIAKAFPLARALGVAALFLGIMVLESCFSRSTSGLLTETKATSEKSQDSSVTDETASDPQNVTGHYLVCQDIDRTFIEATIGCNVYDSGSHSRIDVKSDVKNVNWRTETKSKSTISFFTDTSTKYHAVYRFRRDVSSVDEYPVVFADITTLDGRFETLKSQIDRWRIAISGHRFVRLILTSIHFAEGSSSSGSTTPVKSSEFNLNDQWVPVKADGMTMYVGKYPMKIDASLFDLDLLFNLANGIPVTSLDATSGFSNAPPYDVKSKPITITADFGSDRVKIGGFRVNGGEIIPLDKLPNGSFDKYHMETSDDGINWTPVKESYMDFEKTPDILNHEWGTIDWSQVP
jgi:hypothetical protein